ncbi:hypothetical protein ACFV2X_48130 [Streptomyces sp. NPDC059679]|uniref:hypothetical protein n=1 Tax=Streptomyces sp. NPDC059679 TaxID=3346903 RepID=UPI0036987A8E
MGNASRTTTVRLYDREPVDVTTHANSRTVDRKHTRALLAALAGECQAEADERQQHGGTPRAVKAVRDRKWKLPKSAFDPRPQASAQKPSNRAYSPGSWVSWEHPATGAPMLGIVSNHEMPGLIYRDNDRTVIPADGSPAMVMRTRPGTTATDGQWEALYPHGMSARIQPVSSEEAFSRQN